MPARSPRDPSSPSARSATTPAMPRRGRHPVQLARVELRRLSVGRSPVREARSHERRREQLPLPPGFVDRRCPAAAASRSA